MIKKTKKEREKELSKIYENTGVKYTPYKYLGKDKALLKKLEEYGSSIQEYYEILESQNNVCAICGGVDKNKRLSIDHNHETGEMRGLLCFHCNAGIGHLRESVKNMKKAIEYLDTYNSRF